MTTQPPEVDQAKINEAFYYLAMFLRCLLELAGDVEQTTAPVAFKLKDAANYLACKKRDLRRLRALGDLEPVEIDGKVRWLKSDLDAYVDRLVEASEVEDEAAEVVGMA